ncbi:MAG TPA: hypothetical protein PLP29_02240 [Candidatus Ozemobacteraceae bacterium]|nr:hypothetical protein [Candidatus Ozemobacteraceae bacterium]
MKIVFIIIYIVIVYTALATFIPVSAALQSGPQGLRSEMPEAVRAARVRNLLQRAQAAHLAGNLPEAKRLWNQAHSIDSTLAMPAWLTQPPPTLRNPSDILSSRFLLRRTASMPYELAKPLLEDWLRRFPTDEDVRLQYLSRAEAAGDLAQAHRHRAILHLADDNDPIPFWKYLLIVMLGLFLGWQGRVIYLELIRGRKS